MLTNRLLSPGSYSKCFAFLAYLIVFSLLDSVFAQTKNQTAAEDLLTIDNKDSLWVIKAIDFTREIHRTSHDAQKEYRYAEEAVDAALQLNDTLLYAKALDNLGLLYRYHQWYAQAVTLHSKAFQLVESKSVDPINKMIFANNAGVAARYDQQYDLSISYYLKALKIAEQVKNLKNIAISSNGLGNAISQIPGRSEEALAYFQRALDAETQLGDSLGMAMDLLSISDYYIEKGDFNEAFRHLEQLMDINQKRKDVFGMAITYEYYGHAYFKQNQNIQQANHYYNQARELYLEMENALKAAQMLHSLGKVQEQFGQLPEALKFYDQSISIADSLHSKALIMENAYRISDVKKQQGDYRSSLEYYQMAENFEDSIDMAKQEVQVASLIHQYNLEKKEAQIALLENEKLLNAERLATQQTKIKTERIFYLILLFVALLTIFFIAVQYRNRKAKRVAELKLSEQEKHLLQAEYERNLAQAETVISRMQMNPHFIFNCLNAINLLIHQKAFKNASEYLITFSRFIRMILEMPMNDTISLSTELALVQHYLTLEEKRFNQELQYKIEFDDDNDWSDIMVPPLLLQPFVENAIWHGLLPSNKVDKQLLISITQQDDTTRVSIDDNGVGRKNSHEKQSKDEQKRQSLGMKITQERIHQYNKRYNAHIDLNIIDKENHAGTTIILNIKFPIFSDIQMN
ncbi:tetratricopeptide repeat-containing sensor histidine kinase [Albibacterium indicum]|uniref:tetratricopeptide repeat-containing sensor histidine kinase n=1 Tax=Albibacterium indicum TaxID=2292082 RepID=UPI000E4852F1|nr:tetratricopeptide repeat protein [Pedobacter indicus]